MSETIIRKACDRCHHQKLSCKRSNEDSCERCRKIKVNCTWSPSLRYKRNQQQHQLQLSQRARQREQRQQQQHQPPHTQSQDQPQLKPGPSSGIHTATLRESRSPKRQRTGDDPDPVPPEPVPIASQAGSAEPLPAPLPTEHSVNALTGGEGLDIRDFEFGLGQFEFFQSSPHQHHLAHQQLPQQLQHHHHLEYQQQQHHHRQPNHASAPQLHSQGVPQYHQHTADDHSGFFGWSPDLTSPQSSFLGIAPTVRSAVQELASPSSLPLVSRSRALLSNNEIASSVASSTVRRRGRKHITLRAPDDRSEPSNASKRKGSENISNLDTPLHWMARLSEINARLQGLTALLPAQYDGSAVQEHAFPVDEMFQLTRQIADVLDNLSSAKQSDESGSSTAQGKLDGSDPGSAMFVLSVYVMLLDLFHKVFTLVRSEVFQQASAVTFAFWKLPDVTIGSFAVESTPSLQMSLSIQLAEEFLSRLRRSTAALDPTRKAAAEGGSASIFAGVVDASFQELKRSEDSLRRELAALRGRIEEMLEG